MLRMSALGQRVDLHPPISEILDIRTAKQVAAGLCYDEMLRLLRSWEPLSFNAKGKTSGTIANE